MRHLKAAVLLLAISGAAGRDTLQQQFEQGRGYAGEIHPLQDARMTPHTARGGCTGSEESEYTLTPTTSRHEAQIMYP